MVLKSSDTSVGDLLAIYMTQNTVCNLQRLS